MKGLLGYDIGGSYAFNKTAKTVTLSGLVYSFSLSNLLLINNATANTIIYSCTDTTKSATVSNNIISLAYDTTSMSNTDLLQVWLNFEDVNHESLQTMMNRILMLTASSATIDPLTGAQRIIVDTTSAYSATTNTTGFGPAIPISSINEQYPSQLYADLHYDTDNNWDGVTDPPPMLDLVGVATSAQTAGIAAGTIIDCVTPLSIQPGDFLVGVASYASATIFPTIAQIDGLNNLMMLPTLNIGTPLTCGYLMSTISSTNAIFRLTTTSLANRSLMVFQFRPRPGTILTYTGQSANRGAQKLDWPSGTITTVGKNSIVFGSATSVVPTILTNVRIDGVAPDYLHTLPGFVSFYKVFNENKQGIVSLVDQTIIPAIDVMSLVVAFTMELATSYRSSQYQTLAQHTTVAVGPVDTRWQLITDSQTSYATNLRPKLKWSPYNDKEYFMATLKTTDKVTLTKY